MSRNHTQLNALRDRVRRIVFKRDGYRCVQCGGRTPGMRSRLPGLGDNPYDPANLQTLCRGCHIEKTRRKNWRPLTPAEKVWVDLVEDIKGVALRFRPSRLSS